MSARTSARTVEVARGVHWLPIHGTNVYYVHSAESWVLIDAGFPGSGRIIAETAGRLCGAVGRPGSILITHGHPDHVGSAVGLAAAWNVPILAPAAEMPFIAGTALYPEPLVAWLVRVLPRRAMEALVRDSDLGDTVRPFDPQAGVPGLRDWVCVPTPGHTPGHAAFFRPGDRTLIAGDAVLTMAWASRLGGGGAGSGTWCAASRGFQAHRLSSPVIGETRPRRSSRSPTSTRGFWRPATGRRSSGGMRLQRFARSRLGATERTEATRPRDLAGGHYPVPPDATAFWRAWMVRNL